MAKYNTIWEFVNGKITADEAQNIRVYAKKNGLVDSVAILQSGIINEGELLDYYEQKNRDYPVVREPSSNINIAVLEKFNKEYLKAEGILPFDYDERRKSLSAYVSCLETVKKSEEYIKKTLGKNLRIRFFIATKTYITDVLDNGITDTLDLAEAEVIEMEGAGGFDLKVKDDSQLVNLVNQIMLDAQRMGASDIHIEPYSDKVKIRYRIDGIMRNYKNLDTKYYQNIVNRIKTMASLNSTKNKIMQDGKIPIKDMEIRVNIAPTGYGEKVIMRLLEKKNAVLDISMLGLDSKREKELLRILDKRQGIILVTGPTGSGKSSSLTIMINHLNTDDISITTVEAPIEYRIEGVTQTEVDEVNEITFTSCLRAALRQDPDILMIGEIRDEEGARTATSAANTGMLVLSTIHTNTACSTVMRLVDMGAESYMVADNLNAVLNQRLMRRLCPHCREEYILDESSDFYYLFKKPTKLYRAGKGCDKCMNGYKGRITAIELLVVNDEMRKAISENASLAQITEIAERSGFINIHQDGLEKVKQGITSLEEAHRTLFFEPEDTSGKA